MSLLYMVWVLGRVGQDQILKNFISYAFCISDVVFIFEVFLILMVIIIFSCKGTLEIFEAFWGASK